MPCPRSHCSKAMTFKAEDGTEMETWWSIRRNNLRNMRRMVKRVLLYMALIEGIRVGPDVLVFAGRNGYPDRGVDDFGIAYWAGYVLSWLYLCVFMIVWKPLFSWWVKPSTPSGEGEDPTTTERVAALLKQMNMILLPMSILLSLGEYIFFLARTMIYVDARPVDSSAWPANTRRNWLSRGALLLGIALSMAGGRAVFDILAESGLARVKCVEYMVIVLPIQINIGVLLGSVMQWKAEKRAERKRLAALTSVVLIEEGTTDEKEQLLVV